MKTETFLSKRNLGHHIDVYKIHEMVQGFETMVQKQQN